MSWFARLRNVFRSEKLSVELDEELAFHLAERIDELVAQGMSRNEATRQARLLFGNYSLQKEKTRDMNIASWLQAIRADLTFGARQLRLNPGFTTVAVLSLALGIGANTAIFQLIDAIRLRGLPVHDPSRLAAVDTPKDFFTAGWYSSRIRAFTSAQIDAIRKNQQAFTDLLTFNDTRFNLSTGGRSRFAEGLYVSPNFLKVLGVSPVIGRDFSQTEDKACGSPGVLLNYAFWQREFGGDMNAIGQTLSLDGKTFPIIGVTPSYFLGVEPGFRFDVALPVCAESLFAKDGKGRASNRIAYWLSAIGRLKPGWSVERASSHLHNLSPAIMRASLPPEYRPEEAKKYFKNKLRAVSASAGISSVRRVYENPLWVLMGITGLVLLIACANLANLLLARASAREREIAVRQALGASRPRLIVQMMCESLLLALLGAIFGAVLARVLSRSLVLFLSNSSNQLTFGLGFDWRVFAFTGALAIFTCLLFGLLPALRASASAPASAMRGGRTSTATRERNALRRFLVVSQVALSLVLLVAAILFGRSLQKLFNTSVGFDSQNVLITSVDAKSSSFPNPERRKQLFRELDARLSSLPGVASEAPILFTPLGGFSWNGNVHADSDSAKTGGKESWFNRTGPAYFSTMDTPLLAGRDFTAGDDTHAPEVAIVNRTFSKRFMSGKNPVGRSFRVEQGAGKPDEIYQIVGLVADTKYNELREESQPIAFFPVAQDEEVPEGINLVIRSRASLDSLSHAIQHEIAKINPSLLVEFKVLDVQIRESVLRERLMANLTLGFGFLAACLSTLGLYGVMSYLVARRRGEIGLRIALGAARHNILGLILKDAWKMVAIGLAAGIAASLLLSRYAESLLFDLKAGDPVTLILATTLLALTAAGATLIPASHAARLEPMAALREE